MRTGVAVRCKGKPRRKRMVFTRVAPRMSLATTVSPRCSEPDHHGRRYKLQPDAAGQPWRKLQNVYMLNSQTSRRNAQVRQWGSASRPDRDVVGGPSMYRVGKLRTKN